MTPLSPHAAYLDALNAGFRDDPAQCRAVAALELCHRQLQAGEAAGGIYLWGPVGRGKTWLMDVFFRSLTVPARRLHFHHFMRWVHRRLFQLTGTEDPLARLAAELAAEVRVLCLDELFVSDIGDAMLLGRLWQGLFAEGLVLVTTSNQPPEELYAEGFNRERFLPAVTAMAERMQVLCVDGGEDHRLHPGQARRRYWVRSPGVLAPLFRELAPAADTEEVLALGHRRIPVLGCRDGVLWCRYQDLCEQPLAATDFILLGDRFRHILLEGLPRLDAGTRLQAIARGTEDGAAQVAAGERRLPPLSRQDDGVRRFIALVDECYDRRIPLWLEADVPLDELYRDGALAFPFRRTLSRLREMQLARFGLAAESG